MASERPISRETRRGRQVGFTLVEVLVALGISTSLTGLVVTSIYQATVLQDAREDSAMAAKEWRQAATWFASDTLSAQGTDLVDGAPAVTSATFDWVDGQGQPHAVSYALTGGQLLREADGVQTAVARRVASANLSRTGSVVTLDMDLDRGGEAPLEGHLVTFLRALR